MARTTRVLTAAVFALLFSSSAVSAQWEVGKRYFGPHIGLSGVGSTISFGGAFEQAYNKNIGIGAVADYWSYGTSGWDYSYFALAAMGSYHFPVTDTKIDPFVGLGLGYYIVSFDDNGLCAAIDCDNDASRIFLAGQAGVRYFFRPGLAGVARAGIGHGFLTVGVEWKK